MVRPTVDVGVSDGSYQNCQKFILFALCLTTYPNRALVTCRSFTEAPFDISIPNNVLDQISCTSSSRSMADLLVSSQLNVKQHHYLTMKGNSMGETLQRIPNTRILQRPFSPFPPYARPSSPIDRSSVGSYLDGEQPKGTIMADMLKTEDTWALCRLVSSLLVVSLLLREDVLVSRQTTMDAGPCST